MPAFRSPTPVSITLALPVGHIRVVAAERTDTVVEVSSSDQAAADRIRIDFADGRLTLTGPSLARLRGGLFGWVNTPQIDVSIEVPTGSSIRGEIKYGGFTAEGRLGDCTVGVDYGDVRVEHAADTRLTVSYGDLVVDRVDGDARVENTGGDVRIDEVSGSAAVTSVHGAIRLGTVGGAVSLSSSHGDVSVDRALGGVEAKSAFGGQRIREAVRGEITLTSTYGKLEVGIPEGTAAWLELDSANGRVRNTLDARPGPDGYAETVAVRARSRDGDIVVRRA